MAATPKVRRWLVRYFTFTRSERNGAVILSAVMVALLVIPWLCETVRAPRIYEPDPEFRALVAAFYGWPDTTDQVAACDAAGSSAITGYPAAGDSMAVRGEPASAPGERLSAPGTSFTRHAVELPEPFVVELNRADTACLMAVRGLGPVLSRRIIRYRDLLGGYYCTGQLLEVYGIDSARFLQIIPYLAADAGLVSELDLSGGEFRELLRHPYMDYEQVAWIFRFRESEKIITASDLEDSPLFDLYGVERLRPYLGGAD